MAVVSKTLSSDFGPEKKMDPADPYPIETKTEVKLEDLILLGYAEGEKAIGNFTFKMRTLTNQENKRVATVLSKSSDDVSYAMEAQDVTLAFSILSINETSLESLYDGPDKEGLEDFQKRFRVIQELQPNTISELMMFYNELNSKSIKDVQEKEIKK